MLINPYVFGAYTPTDADAATYILAVEAADGASLESGVRQAIDQFVIGCKADGIWTAIKASCILAGARTLSGALVPLVGPAPTNTNFTSADYNRKTGIKGGGPSSGKSILTNYTMATANIANSHFSAFPTGTISLNSELLGGIGSSGTAGGIADVYVDTSSTLNYYSLWTSNNYLGPLARSGSLVGASRASSASFTAYGNGTAQTISQASVTPGASIIMRVFTRNINGTPAAFSTAASIAFYSMGLALDLALLNARVATLVNAIAAAIP